MPAVDLKGALADLFRVLVERSAIALGFPTALHVNDLVLFDGHADRRVEIGFRQAVPARAPGVGAFGRDDAVRFERFHGAEYARGKRNVHAVRPLVVLAPRPDALGDIALNIRTGRRGDAVTRTLRQSPVHLDLDEVL